VASFLHGGGEGGSSIWNELNCKHASGWKQFTREPS
jgi:hypothetical protein